MAQMNLVQAINQALRTEMRRNENVVVLGEDVGKVGGVFRVTAGLFDEFGDERVIDTPLSEGGIVGAAIGMAIYGLVPVVEIQFADFIYPAYDQIVSELAKLRYRSGGEYPAKLVIRTPYGGGIRGGHYHSQSPEALFIHIPGLKVVCPSNPRDAQGLLLASIRDPDPVLFFEPKRIYRAAKGEVADADGVVELGQAAVARAGHHVTVLAWGAMLYEALEAAHQASGAGVECEVIDLRTLWPVDIETIVASVRKTGRVVVVHEAPKTCGFGAELVALINEKAFLHLEAPPVRVTGWDTPFPYALEMEYLPLAHRILPAVLETARFLVFFVAAKDLRPMTRWEFKLPDIGEGIAEGEIVAWADGVRLGSLIRAEQPLVEVMTDKATVMITCPKNGTIRELGGEAGDVIAVGSNLVVLELNEADSPAMPGGTLPATAASAVGDIREELPGINLAPAIVASTAKKPDPTDRAAFYQEKPLATPATRQLARELAVDLRRVAPSGPNQRVTSDDVRAVANGAAHPAAAQRGPARTGAHREVAGGQVERVPLRGVRKKIFEQMARSKHTAAHSTFVEECDATALQDLRERGRGFAEARGIRLTYLPFIVKATAAALKRHPELNATYDEETSEIVRYQDIHIGIATATKQGLLVPVVKHADRRSVLDLAQEIQRLSAAARDGALPRADLQGSTFTLTSLGQQSGLLATPVLNFPEVGILGIHQIKERPVVREGQIVIGSVMLLSLSFDHRIIDGHVGAAFAYELIGFLQEPESMFLDMV